MFTTAAVVPGRLPWEPHSRGDLTCTIRVLKNDGNDRNQNTSRRCCERSYLPCNGSFPLGTYVVALPLLTGMHPESGQEQPCRRTPVVPANSGIAATRRRTRWTGAMSLYLSRLTGITVGGAGSCRGGPNRVDTGGRSIHHPMRRARYVRACRSTGPSSGPSVHPRSGDTSAGATWHR
jgi:hypothetical protein